MTEPNDILDMAHEGEDFADTRQRLRHEYWAIHDKQDRTEAEQSLKRILDRHLTWLGGRP